PPRARPPAAVPFVPRQLAPAMSATPTSVSFSKELDGLGAPNLPAPNFSASSNEAPESVRFRVAVGDRGEIRYCFPLNSSGDPALDEQARRYLALCRFSQSSISGEKIDRSLTWGIATVGWGNDVAHPRHMATSTPTP